jgi:hypothetical protein
LVAAGERALPLLKERLRPAMGVDGRRLQQLITDLDHDQFATRTAAFQELKKLGRLAGPTLRRALTVAPSAEGCTIRNADEITSRLEGGRGWSLLSRDIKFCREIRTRGFAISRRLSMLDRVRKAIPGRPPMPRPLPVPVREILLRRWQQGQAVSAIAEDLDLVSRTVRHLLRRFRQQPGAGLLPAYHARPTLTPPPLVEAGLRLRREHPTWGAGLIRVLLLQDYPEATVPSTRTLQRWFGRTGLSPAPAGRRPASVPPRADRPHRVWQVDAADQVALRTGQLVS